MKKKIILIAPPNQNSEPPQMIKKQFFKVSDNYDKKLEKVIQNLTKDEKFKYDYESVPALYGLLCIARALHENDIEFKLIYGLNEKEIFRKINTIISENVTHFLIGISTYTYSWQFTINLSDYIKSYNKNNYIVIGGPHATFDYEKCLTHPCIDAVICYGGEKLFCELAKKFVNNFSFEDISDTFFITKKNVNNHIKTDTNFYSKHDTIPSNWQIPLYSLLHNNELSKYFSYIMAKRGCVRRCPFCVEGKYYTNNFEEKSPSMVVSEITELLERTQKPFIHFADSSFFSDINYGKNVLEKLMLMKNPPAISINVHLEDLAKQEIISAIKGCFLICEILIGIETLSDIGMRIIRRKLSFEEVKDRLYILRNTGIPLVFGYTMVGLPKENINDLKQSTDRVKQLLSYGFIDCALPRFFVPYPGTPFFSFPHKYNIQINNTYEIFDRWDVSRPVIGDVMSGEEILPYMKDILEYQL